MTTPFDIVDDTDGLVSLREAVLEANQNSDQEDTIRFSPEIRGETIALTIPFNVVDTPETGDLDISNGTISIIGFDRESSIIDLSALGHRAFQVGGDAVLNVSHMTIVNGQALQGGAIKADSRGHLTVDDVHLTENNADEEGGAIYIEEGTIVSVVDSALTRNAAIRGGAVMTLGNVEASGIQFLGNEATDRGGAIAAAGEEAELVVHSSAFVNNEAGGGAAISNDGATSYVANATLAGNRSRWGGALLNRADGNATSFLQVLQSTIVDDLSTQAGPIHSAARDQGNVRTQVGNTIIHDTTGPNSLTTFAESEAVSVDVSSLGHNLLYDDGGGLAAPSDLVGIDTESDPFMDSRVRFRGGDVWVYEVFANSPSINAGNDALIANHDRFGFLFDQRGDGFERVHDGQVDIGAFEFQSFDEQSLVVTSLLDSTDPNDGVTTLREAIERANAQSGHDTVRFADKLFEQGVGRIELQERSLPIRTAVTIAGPGSDRLILDGQADTRVLDVWFGDFDVQLSGFTISGGATFTNNPSLGRDEPLEVSANSGPAIRSFSDGTLTLDSLQITDNSTLGDDAHG
ncbi:MAG: CSLREA domain-containing protein, partial [Rhodopirellula bahusiensis]